MIGVGENSTLIIFNSKTWKWAFSATLDLLSKEDITDIQFISNPVIPIVKGKGVTQQYLIATKEGLYFLNITKEIKGMHSVFKVDILNDTCYDP